MATAKTPKTTTAKTTKAKRPTVTKTAAAPVTTDNVVPLQGDIAAQIETLKADLKSLAATVKTSATTVVENRGETVKAVATEKSELAKARYDELSTQAETQIREKPLSSMAIAVGAGVLLGALLRG